MTWKAYITSDPDVVAGKPVLRGTRLTVDFLLGLLAAGWTQEQVFGFDFPAEVTQDEALHVLRRGA